MSSHWFFLLAAIAVEIGERRCDPFRADVAGDGAPDLVFRVVEGGDARALIGLSFALLSIALRVIPLAVAYAVWEGLGIVGIAVVGHLLFGEHLTAERIVALAAILAGILLLERGVGDAPVRTAQGRPA